jgi:hypothetical protein
MSKASHPRNEYHLPRSSAEGIEFGSLAAASTSRSSLATRPDPRGGRQHGADTQRGADTLLP